MTISNLTKTAESYPKGQKTLWEMEKLLVTSNFSFSHSVFKMLVSQGRQKVSLCGNGFSRGEIRKYAGKKVCLNLVLNSQPPGHESDMTD